MARSPSDPRETAPEPQARRRRAPVMDKGERRRSILDAALAEFAAHGFAGTRLDDVARRAGVAKGTLYLYFSDKEALFRGLVQETLTPVLADAGGMVALFPGTTRELLDLLKRSFENVRHAKPPASRKDSSEWYVIAQGFKERG